MVLLAYADVDTSVVLLPEDVRGVAKAVGARAEPSGPTGGGGEENTCELHRSGGVVRWLCRFCGK